MTTPNMTACYKALQNISTSEPGTVVVFNYKTPCGDIQKFRDTLAKFPRCTEVPLSKDFVFGIGNSFIKAAEESDLVKSDVFHGLTNNLFLTIGSAINNMATNIDLTNHVGVAIS